MQERPALDKRLDSETFRDFYWLKAELLEFCRKNGIPSSGGKIELSERIARFLETGEIAPSALKQKRAAAGKPGKDTPNAITEDAPIENGFVCTQRHRAFFAERLGKGFTFNAAFQGWLKSNPGKTYRDAIAAYRRILAERKETRPAIGRQFEYNAYIRDFFADNPGRSLSDATRCWRRKKSTGGHNRYEKSDLQALRPGQEEKPC